MKRMTVPAILLIALLTLGGCSGAGGFTEEIGLPAAEPNSGGDFGGERGEGAPSLAEEIDSDREVVVTGSIYITATDPIAASETTVQIVEAAGGRIDARTEYAATETDNGRAVLTLRIPSAALNRTLGELKNLGTVEQIQTSSDDVTRQGQDLDARISALSVSIDRLLELMAGAQTTEILLTLEREITDRQAQLDSLRAARSLLSDQVSMSTIVLTLSSVAAAPVGTPSTFVDALVAGWASFIAFFTGLAFVLGYLLPWIVLLGILALVTVILVKRRTKPAIPAVDA